MKPVQAVIVDDSARSRAGLRALLATCSEVEVVAEASDGREALTQIDIHEPDAVLMDVRMPQMDGLAATAQIKSQYPHIRVVLLSMYAEYQQAARTSGAEAFLIKGCSVEQLLQALLSHTLNNCDD